VELAGDRDFISGIYNYCDPSGCGEVPVHFALSSVCHRGGGRGSGRSGSPRYHNESFGANWIDLREAHEKIAAWAEEPASISIDRMQAAIAEHEQRSRKQTNINCPSWRVNTRRTFRMVCRGIRYGA